MDAPRAAGMVGERWDGFAKVRDTNATADVTALFASTNAKRRAVYQTRASSEGTNVVEVGRIYAQQIISAAPMGTWSLSENGSWSQK